MTAAARPLDGVRVVELGQYIAVPAAAQLLVDEGATVVKVEPPAGEAARHGGAYGLGMVHAYNRGKLHAIGDLTDPEDVAFIVDLITGADVVLSNLRPGVLEKFGIDLDAIRDDRPGLIVVTLSGFGNHPDFVGRPGLDIAAQAESGLMWTTGEADGEPQRIGSPIVDASAAYVIAQAVTTALFARSRHGEGADIRVNLWDVAIHLQGATWGDFQRTGVAPTRKGNGHPQAAPGADLYRVKDGYIVMSAYMPAHWKALCAALDLGEIEHHPDFAEAAARATRRPELTKILENALAHLTRDEAVRLLTAAGVVSGAVREIPEVAQKRGISAAGPFIPGPEAAVPWQVGMPFQWAGVSAEAAVVAEPGADDRYVREELRARWTNQEGTGPS